MASNGNMTITPLVTKKLNYDPIRELRVIAVLAEIPTVIVSNLQVPISAALMALLPTNRRTQHEHENHPGPGRWAGGTSRLA